MDLSEREAPASFPSEFDVKAQNTYEKNYWETPFGDITSIPPELIPDHDVILAGFPCQPFSHAGLKLGIEDTRGTLFYNIAAILIKNVQNLHFWKM